MEVIDFFKTAAILIIFGFLWRLATARLADTRLGQAMAFIY